MAPPNNSQTPLFDLPEELFQQILRYLRDPADYLHLSATSRAMMNRMDPDRECYLLDAELFREYIEPVGQTRRQVYLMVRPFNSILNWYLRRHQPVYNIWIIVQNYLAVFPEAIHGSYELGLSPAWQYAIRFNHDEALQLLMDAGLTLQ
ncbi:hypothetical protein F4781DRAFT_442670 [Annulohypoxylon bovei var. microspora]|nr:hypothetical protein F4781DRAFT_442670 [Annulohypoxylon bovei var. microspora]